MKKFLIIIGIVLILPLVVGTLYYPQNSVTDMKIPCLNNNTYCSVDTTCNLTIIYPNGSVLINDDKMTNGGVFFNYTLNENQTTLLGEYPSTMICNDTGIFGYTTFTYEITGTGNAPASDFVTAMFLLFFIVLLFYLMLFMLFGLKHFKSLDFDINDLAYNFGGYFALFGYYMMENAYLGNSTISSFSILLLEVGSVTNIFLPLIAYFLSITIGKKRALKMAEDKEIEEQQ